VAIAKRADVMTDDLVRNGGGDRTDPSRARELHDFN
jgi:hypothetical protein